MSHTESWKRGHQPRLEVRASQVFEERQGAGVAQRGGNWGSAAGNDFREAMEGEECRNTVRSLRRLRANDAMT